MKNFLLKKSLLMLAFLFVGWSAMAQFSGGTGTELAPYQIANLTDLQTLSENSAYWASGTYFIQTADINASATSTWNGGVGFSPIGNATTQFLGNYNGGGYTINGLYINSPTATTIGLFGWITATISNLGLTNVNLTSTYNNGTTSLDCYAGGLVGRASSPSTISNCYSSGSVSGFLSSGFNTGGLVGYANGSKISNCYSSGEVSGFVAGGFMGFNYSGSVISKCNSTAQVSGYKYAGGFAGYSFGPDSTKNCYSRGKVIGTNSSGYIGGFVGFSSSVGPTMPALGPKILNCYSSGEVTGLGSKIGGFVGSNVASTINYSYYDNEASGMSVAYGSTSGGTFSVTGLNTAQMKDQSNLSNLDFTNIWAVDATATINDGYPYLQGQPFAPASQPMQLVFTTTAPNQSIALPLYGTVNCTVDWGDGSATEDFTTVGNKSHTFAAAGTYTVEISGTLTQFGHENIGWTGSNFLSQVPSFGNTGLTSLAGAFYAANQLTSVPSELPATITDLSYAFAECPKSSITNLNLWDVSNVTDLSSMFENTEFFNQNISNWNVSNVTNMSSMFNGAEVFNQDISNWTVSNVVDMGKMFLGDIAFNQNIGNWDVSNVTNMGSMFVYALAFNQNIGNWNVSSVTDMSYMFTGAISFNQDISTKTVNAGQPNQYTAWNVGNVTDMTAMLAGDIYELLGFAINPFNHDISNWDVSSVGSMEMMFALSEFDQNIGSWNIGNVMNMADMFYSGSLSTANYDALLTGWAAQTVQNGVEFSAGNTKYSAGAAATARASLISDDNWDITDGGMSAATYTWNGSSSSNWNTAANWDLNAVPTASDNVVIANAGTAPVIGSSNQITCNQLTVNAGASLTINSGGSLIATSATGTVTVKRSLNGTSQYHFLSSPVNNADLATIFDESNQDDVYLRRFDEPTGNWVNLEIPANLTNGVGYSYIWQSKAVGIPATFTGSLITSDLSPAITFAGAAVANYQGYNLLGNPFTSAIQWGAGNWNRNNVDNAVYVWSNGVYKSYVDGVSGGLTNGIIPAQQGFFVKANAASPSITIPAAARVHNTQSFYKNSVANVLRLDVANNVNEYADATFIHFTPEATALFDSQFDAYKLQNDPSAPMIYTHAGDVTLSINSLPAIEDNNEIPVSFTAGVDGRYTLTASGMETFANGNIVLTDLATNATQNLSQNPVYSFDATTTDQPDRFKVSFATVGVNDNPLQNIGVYASNGRIVLQLPQATKAEVTIANLAGQVTARQSINATGNVTINAPVTTGVYLVTLTTAEGTITRKVIVN